MLRGAGGAPSWPDVLDALQDVAHRLPAVERGLDFMAQRHNVTLPERPEQPLAGEAAQPAAFRALG